MAEEDSRNLSWLHEQIQGARTKKVLLLLIYTFTFFALTPRDLHLGKTRILCKPALMVLSYLYVRGLAQISTLLGCISVVCPLNWLPVITNYSRWPTTNPIWHVYPQREKKVQDQLSPRGKKSRQRIKPATPGLQIWCSTFQLTW